MNDDGHTQTVLWGKKCVSAGREKNEKENTSIETRKETPTDCRFVFSNSKIHKDAERLRSSSPRLCTGLPCEFVTSFHSPLLFIHCTTLQIKPYGTTALQLGLPTLAEDKQYKMKSKWNEKREKKLRKAYDEIMKDQYMSVAEVKKCLGAMGYILNDQQCLCFLYTIDTNRDGHIQWEEFRDGVKQLVTTFAKNGKKQKKDKKKEKK